MIAFEVSVLLHCWHHRSALQFRIAQLAQRLTSCFQALRYLARQCRRIPVPASDIWRIESSDHDQIHEAGVNIQDQQDADQYWNMYM